MQAALRRMRRRAQLDFSDYLELRHLRDHGDRDPEIAQLMASLERALPVAFASAIPHMVTLADAPASPPRGLTREAVRVMFAMREEFAGHGRARSGLMGFDLPDADGLKDWLDFIENERRHAMQVRASLRELDRRIWAVYTGERRMPMTTAATPTTKGAGSDLG